MSYLNATVTYTDEQNNSYQFDLYSKDHDFNNSWGGIYIFTNRYTKDEKLYHSLKYIGKAKSFDKRFDSHDKIDMSGINCIGVYKEANEANRVAIEKSLIKKNKPPLNTQHT